MKRTPLRVKVRINRCAAPSSPSARRTALIRVVSADSETIRPPHTACKQIVLADHPVPVLHQIGQQIEDLGFDVNQFAAATQFAALDVEPVVAKRQTTPAPGSLPRLRERNRKTTVRKKKAGRKAFRPHFSARMALKDRRTQQCRSTPVFAQQGAELLAREDQIR